MAVRRLLPWLLAATLVAAQLLSLMHRVVHLPHVAGPAIGVVEVHAAPGIADDAHDGLLELFSGHDDSSCRLYDALGFDAAPVPVLALSLPLPVFVRLHFLLGEFLARRAALFEARGPPFTAS